MSTVRNIRQLRGRLQAEVGIGLDDVGVPISVTVELDLRARNNPELADRVAALHEVIERQALAKVEAAHAWRNRDGAHGKLRTPA